MSPHWPRTWTTFRTILNAIKTRFARHRYKQRFLHDLHYSFIDSIIIGKIHRSRSFIIIISININLFNVVYTWFNFLFYFSSIIINFIFNIFMDRRSKIWKAINDVLKFILFATCWIIKYIYIKAKTTK